MLAHRSTGFLFSSLARQNWTYGLFTRTVAVAVVSVNLLRAATRRPRNQQTSSMRDQISSIPKQPAAWITKFECGAPGFGV